MVTMDAKKSRVDGKDSDESGINSKSTQSSTTTRSLRGKVYLNNLARRKAKGIREEVYFNELGQPVGPIASEMQSYIGLLARQEVKVSYATWRNVPKEVKDLIWETVNLSYVVDAKWKSGCLESANSKWKQWKTKLYNDHILPYTDNPVKLTNPPPCSGILPEDWNRFVISRMSDDFKELSQLQKERRMKNIYPHRLSRTGYAGLAEKMKDELCGDDDIDRAVMWKKARMPKDGHIEDENLKKTVEKIDDFIKQKEDGLFKPTGLGEDLLTCALGKPEHSGRVRAIGSYITPSVYFKYPKGGRRSHDKAELLEAKKEICESREMIKDLYKKFEEMHEAMKKDKDAEEKGSCSVKSVKPCCKDDFIEDEVTFMDKKDILQGKVVSLMLDSSNGDIVAYGTVLNIQVNNLSGFENLKNCTCVSIDDVVDANALLPHPIPDVLEYVGDAVGSQVAWPTCLIEVKDKRPSNKKNEANLLVKKRPIKCYDTLNPSLKALYWYVEGAMKDGQSIFFKMDEDVFGDACQIFIHAEDIIPFCDMEPISGNCIVVYVWHLYKKMKAMGTLTGFRFVNSFLVSHMPKASINLRIQALGDRLIGVRTNQLVVVPCNVGQHWILTLIDPHKEVVYLLDPLGSRSRDDTWKNIVDRSISLFNANLGKKGKKQPTWEFIKAPRQPDFKQCGFFVMRYMKEIIEDCPSGSSLPKFKKESYSFDEIDEIRAEWAKCLLHYI